MTKTTRDRSDSSASVPDDVWGDFEELDDTDLASFDNCFSPEDFLIDDEEAAYGNETETPAIDEDEAKKRFQEPGPPRVNKRRKSIEFNSFQEYACDASDDLELNTDTASVQSAQLPFLTPMELDQQLDQSISRLALSMKRSELSREQVLKKGGVASSAVGLSHLLRGGSSSTLSSGRSHLRSYMHHMGSTIWPFDVWPFDVLQFISLSHIS